MFYSNILHTILQVISFFGLIFRKLALTIPIRLIKFVHAEKASTERENPETIVSGREVNEPKILIFESELLEDGEREEDLLANFIQLDRMLAEEPSLLESSCDSSFDLPSTRPRKRRSRGVSSRTTASSPDTCSLRKLQQFFAFRDKVPSLTGIDRTLVIPAENMARVVSGFEARDVKRVFMERERARRTFDARKRNFDIRDVNRNIDTRRAIKQSFGSNFDSPDVKFSVDARDVRQNFERRDEAALKRVRQHFESRDVYCQYRQV